MNKSIIAATAFIGLGVSVLSWSDSATAPTVQYTMACGSQNITLGMSSEAVLAACGEPTKVIKRKRNGAQYLKAEYSFNGATETNLKLRFSDMQTKGELKLYKIEYEKVQNSANPYKKMG